MKKAIVTLFCIIILLPTTLQVCFMAYFYTNQETITTKYCINKQNPSKHCNGKCYLSSSLEKMEDHESEKSSSKNTPLKEKSDISDYYSIEPFSFNFHNIDFDCRNLFPQVNHFYTFLWSSTIEYPPAA